MNGLVITREENYLGMASGADLLRALTKMQIDAARHANPLTQLPGNVPINQKIDQLVDTQNRLSLVTATSTTLNLPMTFMAIKEVMKS